MITIEPTIKIYDDEGNLSKAYDKAVDKMIDKTYDIDLEQFDFDEVANGKSKELDNLVVKLCKESGLGSKDIYTMLLDRFEAEYDVPVDFVVYLGKDWEDDFEESKKSARKSLKEVAYSYNDYMAKNTFDDLASIFEEWKDEIGAIGIKLDVNYFTISKKDFENVTFDKENLFWFSSYSSTNVEIHIGDKIKPKFDNGELFVAQFEHNGRITFYSKN